METRRQKFRGRGNFVCTIPWDGMTPDAHVMASIAEAHEHGVGAGGHYVTRFMGNASLTVHTVVPSHGKVDVRVHVDWHDDLWFEIDLLRA